MKLFAAAGILSLLLVVGWLYSALGVNFFHTAEEDAERWAAVHVPNYRQVRCLNQDTKGEGYVACMVLGNTPYPIGIECAASLWNQNRGCRIPQMNYPPK